MILDNKQCKWEHHSCGVFTNPIKRTSFEFQQEDGTVSADILKIDARFVSLCTSNVLVNFAVLRKKSIPSDIPIC